MTKKTYVKSLISVLVGIAFVVLPVFALTPQTVRAQTRAQLQAQIQTLLAQLSELQALLNARSGNAGALPRACAYTFTRNLTLGSQGEDVRILQEFLNSGLAPSNQIALSGVGSKGQETTFYGPLTLSAVSRFQARYAAQVLFPLGLTTPTGFFGPSTKGQIQRICATAQIPPTTPPPDDDDDSTLEGGEGSISTTLLGSPSNAIVEEGEDNEDILGFEVEARSGDIRIERIEIELEAQTTIRNDSPWVYFENVSLWQDDNMIAELDTDSRSDWTQQSADTYSLRFDNVDEVVREDNEKDFFVRVTAHGSIDSSDMPQEWEMRIPRDGIRAIDGLGINHYDPSSTLSRTFTVEEVSEADVSLDISSSFNTDRVVQVDADDETDNVTLLEFEIVAEDRDVRVEDLSITVHADDEGGSDERISDIVNTLYLYQGSNRVATETITGTDTGSTGITFENINMDIETSNNEEFSIRADIDSQSENFEIGSRLSVDIDANDLEIEDEQGNSVDISGSVDGPWIYLYTDAPRFELVSTSQGTLSGQPSDGQFTVVFDVTAVGDDVYIGENIASAQGAAVGAVFDVLRGGSDVTASANTSAVLTSTATHLTNTYRVRDGETRRFTLTVIVDNTGATAGFYQIDLDEVGWATRDTTSMTYTSAGLEDFETGVLYLNASN